EAYQGGGGSYHEDYHTRCVDRGHLLYGIIENTSSGVYYSPYIDQEVTNNSFIANLLLNAPSAPDQIVAGVLSPGTLGTYVQQDNGGYAPSFIGTSFTAFGAPPELIDFTNGTPTKPAQLINANIWSGIPQLSNIAG